MVIYRNRTERSDQQKKEQRDALNYEGLVYIRELEGLLKINDMCNQINDKGKLKAAIESLENIKMFLEQDQFIEGDFNYTNLQDWEGSHKNKEIVYSYYARMLTAPELRDAIEYNAGQLLQNLDALKKASANSYNGLLRDEFYEPLRVLRNHIEHGNHILDAQPYIPGAEPDILDNKSKIIGPITMKLIIEFLPELEQAEVIWDCSNAIPFWNIEESELLGLL